MAELLIKAMLDGGPYAIGIAGWFAWWYERRQNKEMGEQLLKLAKAQIEATVKHETAIRANTTVIDRLLAR
jgi:hypothetical protein